MLNSPFTVVPALLLIVGVVMAAERWKWCPKIFNVLPSVFWIYFLPMVASTCGLIDPKAPTLSWITGHILPMSLFLLLVTVDVPAIFRLGGKALGLFFIGSFGIMIGTVVAFGLVKGFVGGDFWSGFGALSASWTGGSANMISVKEALAVPDNIYLPMVVVDTIVPYLWMGLLIAAVRWESRFDLWNRADRGILEDLGARLQKQETLRTEGRGPQKPWVVIGVKILIIHAAIVAGFICHQIGAWIPAIPNVISATAWTIILVSFLALALSFTPLRRWRDYDAPMLGQRWLYLVLAAIGAKASLSDLGTSLILIGAGFVIVLIHAGFLLVGARLLRAPLFLVASASQANIGGVASAPAVAAIYEPGLASVGLLLAILGNIVGTYLGILAGQLCRMVV